MKQLLARDDVNPDKPDVCGQTPLYKATHNGHEGVVRLLLGQDGAPLLRASEGGISPSVA